MGGDHRVGPPLLQQLLQGVQEKGLKHRAELDGGVFGELVIHIKQAASPGDQQVEALIHGLGGVGHGVGDQVHHLRPHLRERPQELLPQGFRGGPVAHAKFSGEYEDVQSVPLLFTLPSIMDVSLENIGVFLKFTLRITF